MNNLNRNNINEKELISLFNNRDKNSFVSIYSLFFNELCHFTNHLSRSPEFEAEDIVHDMFIYIWEKNDLSFSSLNSLKAYLYIGIKNKFKNYIDKNRSKCKYENFMINDENFYISQMAISETMNLIHEAVKFLPADCAEIFRLFMEGYDIKEIVEHVNMSKSHVYMKKQKAINILKKQFPHLYLLLFL